MAAYNTFVVCACKTGKPVLVTSSARKARGELRVGLRMEVWNENSKVNSITWLNRYQIDKYIRAEKDYISRKQMIAETHNRMRQILGA